MFPIQPLFFLQKEMKMKMDSSTKPNQVTGAISSLASQTTSTRRFGEEEIEFPKAKVLVRPLQVPQLFLAREVRKWSPEEQGT